VNNSGQRYGGNAPFNQPMNIILNLAIGGNWPCSISGCCSSVNAPAQMEIYSVQIWEVAQDEEEKADWRFSLKEGKLENNVSSDLKKKFDKRNCGSYQANDGRII